MADRVYRLSKSRFQTGLQCWKALWLRCHSPELADPIDEVQRYIFDTGTAVGELARERFAGGVLVAEDHTQSEQALETTQRLLEDPPAALFEAALVHRGVFVRPDVLIRVDETEWDLCEVKSSTMVKPEHITDVAIQTWVLEGKGLKVRRAYLMHLNNTYVYRGGEYDLGQLFTADDVTAEVRAWLPQVPPLVEDMLAMLEGAEPPMPIGKHCDNPYTCAFYGHCHAFLPERPITALARIDALLLDRLVRHGIYSVSDIPVDFPGLTAAQRKICEVVQSGEPRFEGDIHSTLTSLEYPVHFVDFETIQPALPLYAGTRPWQQIPFQWSDHVLHENGDLEHREFLYEGAGDPRSRFTESLVDALDNGGSIVVYTSFENTRLTELAQAFPKYSQAVAAIQSRLFDLERAVRAHVQHPDCLGRTSIKVVVPALCDGLSYDDLAIADGVTASLRYLRVAKGEASPEECEVLFADLRRYCQTDTLAMVRLLDVLRNASGGRYRA